MSVAWRMLLLLLLLTTINTIGSVGKELRVVCYYTNWSVYRPGTAKFSPQNINPYLCTHLVYAFGGFTKENTLKPFDKYQDIEKGGYAKFTGLKTYNKNLKTMLAIGGWNEGSSRFSPMVANSERRKELVKNTIKFLRQNHFDGLDLDWEYPSFRDGGKPRDKDNYAQLVQELREEFDRESEKTGRPRLLLTMAVPAGIEYVNKGYDVPKLMKHLDWMNILSYDYHSAFEPAVNHHAPLFPLEEDNEYNYDAELNIDYTIKHYVQAGADLSKLVLGIPTYGRSYTLYNPEANEIGAPADGPGDMGEATRENGYLAYYEICERVKSEGWTVVQPNPDAMGPYAYRDNQWVGYDDEDIVRKKSKYVAEKGLGGIMFWSIDNDDFRGACHDKPYPLIEAGKEALVEAYGLTDDNSVSAPTKSIKSKAKPHRGKVTASSSTESTKNAGGRQGSIPRPTRRQRIQNKKTEEPTETSTRSNKVHFKKDRLTSRRGESKRTTSSTTTSSTTTASSLIVTPSYTTPAPPPTPDPGSDFKCEDEGFFPHPRDCKKYFWCLSSGPSDLGIVAHQFTCPSGLYFNKAADSCDYTQNVLCNKKAKSTTTTTTTTTTTSTEPTSVSTTRTTTRPARLNIFSTQRVPMKITAATSRTTFSTTTSAPEEEYEEYEYDDEAGEEENGKKLSEEDPEVIKELINLIKKAGGLEELEKHLKIHDNGTASIANSTTTGSTTQASIISKSLYERVLRNNVKNSRTTTPQPTPTKKDKQVSYNTINRNSRGPQTDGLNTEEAKNTESSTRGRFQYVNIARRRSTTGKPNESDDPTELPPDEESVTERVESATTQRHFRRMSTPEYVTIRRTRPSTTTTSTTTETNPSTRSRDVLGEKDESNKPEYVNVKRQRTTTEATTTSKYKILRRGTTTTTTTTTTEAAPATTIKSEPIASTNVSDSEKDATTLSFDSLSVIALDSNSTAEMSKPEEAATTIKPVVPLNATKEDASNQKHTGNVPNLISSPSLEATEKIPAKSETQTKPSVSISSKIPHLFEPRPFSLNSRKESSTTVKTETTTPAAKGIVRTRPYPFLRRTTTKAPTSTAVSKTRTVTFARRKPRPTPTSTNTESQELPVSSTTTQKPPNRFRFTPKRASSTPKLKVTTASYEDDGDQTIVSSNQASLEEDSSFNTTELSNVLQELQQAPIRSSSSTRRPFLNRGSAKPSVGTHSPVVSTTPRFLVKKQKTVVFDKATSVSNTFKPSSDYDYYDEGVSRIVSKIPEHSKVLIHSSGAIECLDQGNFPHPASCKKFINCAKMINNNLVGFEYTCPKDLSFDPVGEMCNWAAGLGCYE